MIAIGMAAMPSRFCHLKDYTDFFKTVRPDVYPC